jgi:hypothetical protein
VFGLPRAGQGRPLAIEGEQWMSEAWTEGVTTEIPARLERQSLESTAQPLTAT